MWGWIVLLVVIALPVFWGIGTYNRLVTARNAYRNAFSQIDVQLQRRFDLIPNLVETAKAYLAHERQTLDAVIAARSAAQAGLAAAKAQPGDASAMAQLSAAQGQLEAGLGRLMVVVEAYPDLKGNQNMMQVSEELASTENRLSFARQAYNDSVMAYNNQREVFPASLIANNYRFSPAAALELPSEQAAQIRAAPRIQF
jgi:LemA protein